MVRAELAQKILAYKSDTDAQRFVLLRDLEGVKTGDFRDLDIFAKDFNARDFQRFLEENGFLIVKKIRRYKFHQYCVLSKEHSVFILIDIWTKLHFHGVAYFKDFQPEIEYAEEGFAHLSVADSLRVSLVKCLTQTGKIKDKYLDAVASLSLDADALTRDSILDSKTQSAGSAAVHKLAWFAAHVRDFFRSKQLIIYLIGPDGAGKTTISEALLGSEIRAATKYYHGRIPFLPRLQKLKGEKPKKVKYSDTNKRKFTVVHAIYYSLDSLLVRVVLNLSFFKDRVIVCDRTHYDIVARETYRNIPPFIKKSLVLSLYRPNHCFLLYCDPQQIHDRKPELPVDEIEAQYKAYGAHKKWLRYSTVHTDANAKSVSEIAAVIHEDLHRN